MTDQTAIPPMPAPPAKRKKGHAGLIAAVVAVLVVLGIAANAATSKPKPVASPDTVQPSAPDTSGTVAESGTATEQRLCAALDGNPKRLPPLIDAVSNDAESGISLSLEGISLELHLAMTNNRAKVAQDIQDMRDTCASQAG